MDVTRFVLLGDSVLASARERASGALTAWRAAWGVEGEGLDVATARAAAERCGEPGWRAYRAGDATLAWVRFDDLALEAFEDAMFRNIERDAPPREASKAWRARWRSTHATIFSRRCSERFAESPPFAAPSRSRSPRGALPPWRGTLYLRVHAADAVCTCSWLTRSSRERRVTPKPEHPQPLRSRTGMPRVSDMPITLQAQLGSIESSSVHFTAS